MKTIFLVMQVCYYKNGIKTTAVVNAYESKEQAKRAVQEWTELDKVLPEEDVTIIYSLKPTKLF